ncbi:MAG: hypothetical protein M3253_08280, partial [Chloroflexota bacterium]|nr:hypothetical protein [Chloroflexota bacterium]
AYRRDVTAVALIAIAAACTPGGPPAEAPDPSPASPRPQETVAAPTVAVDPSPTLAAEPSPTMRPSPTTEATTPPTRRPADPYDYDY